MRRVRGTKSYVYVIQRVSGKPRTIYLGTGPAAEQAAAEIERRRQARQTAAEQRAGWATRVASAENPLDELCAALELLAGASLLALGYHRQDRSPWRKRRERPDVPTE